jgi:ABC-type microcin C transport system permease subunit YejB
MLSFIIRRTFSIIPTLLGVSIIIFLMLAITPGDPAELLLGERATEETLETMREHLGLNEPLYVQYGMFLKRLIKFDLGETIWTRQKVWHCSHVSELFLRHNIGHHFSHQAVFLVRLHEYDCLANRCEYTSLLAGSGSDARFLFISWMVSHVRTDGYRH